MKENKLDPVSASNYLIKLFAQSSSSQEYIEKTLNLLRSYIGGQCAGIRVFSGEGRYCCESCVGFEPSSCGQGREFKELINQCVFVETFNIPITHRSEVLGAIYLSRDQESSSREVEPFIRSVAPTIGDAVYRFNMEEMLRRTSDSQIAINLLLSLALQEISLEEYLNQVLELILGISWLTFEQIGAIFLVEDDPGVLVMKVQNNLSPLLLERCLRVPFGTCLCGQAALKGRIQFASCLDERHTTTYEGIRPHGHYCIPIISKETILGVINLYVKDGHQRNQSEEVFLTAIANTLAGIILRKKAEDALKQGITNLRLTLEGTVKTLAIITEKRDPYTAGHQQRVAELASNIAREMGLPAEQIESIRIAGTLHDIGKISIPSDILNKPSELTELEKALIFTHPQAGYDMLRTIPFSFPAAEIILQHHERIDGSGYPNGIKGDAILLEAKIIAVADVVEAMLSHRPYRPALSLEEALYEINRHRNSLFDAEVVDACIRLLLVTI